MAEAAGGLSREEREENAVAQREELEALEAIYGDDFKVLVPAQERTNEEGSAARLPQVRLRVSETPLVSLHLRLPEGYPSHDYPVHDIIAPGLSQAARRKLSEALRPLHGDKQKEFGAAIMSPPGAAVVFDWVETLRELLSQTYDNDSRQQPAAPITLAEDSSDPPVRLEYQEDGHFMGLNDREGWKQDDSSTTTREDRAGSDDMEGFVEIVHGEAFTDRKSTFQAHLAKVSSERQVTWARHRLMENSKIARATHNVAAWRIWDESRGVQLHDNDDDGESAAGSRLAHMLAITGAQNVLVVVSRWFGGIHLGPDRFKHINNAARELLVQCGATDNGNVVASGAGRNTANPAGTGGGKPKGRRKRGSGGRQT